MLLRNDLLEYAGEHPLTLRILWIDAARRLAYTYALGERGASPRAASLDTPRYRIHSSVLAYTCSPIRAPV